MATDYRVATKTYDLKDNIYYWHQKQRANQDRAKGSLLEMEYHRWYNIDKKILG